MRPGERAIDRYGPLMPLISAGSRVLDLGCGAGDLMKALSDGKNCDCTGIDRDPRMVSLSLSKKLKVFNLDFNDCLAEFPDRSYDVVILNNSLQESRFPGKVINESLRVGRQLIIGFPNFASLRSRVQLFFRGRAPVTRSLPGEWHSTPNLRFLTVRDFREYCRAGGITIKRSAYSPEYFHVKLNPNLFAENAVFLLEKK